MRVRLTHREHVAELAVYFRGRGFLVVDRGGNELDVHPTRPMPNCRGAFAATACSRSLRSSRRYCLLAYSWTAIAR